MLLYHVLASTIHGKISNRYTKVIFKISAPTWNDKFELPDRSYPAMDVQDFLSIASQNMKLSFIILQYEYM